MRIAILGPTDVRAGDGSAIEVRGGRLRALLVRLALENGRPVSTTTLIDALWGEDPPAAVANALQSLVSRLRTALGSPDAVRSGPAGYTLSGAEVDAAEFERLVTAARSADPATALDLLTSATALWRGEALADVRDAPFATAPAARLDDLRLAAEEDRGTALLALGRAGEAVAALAPLAAAHPLRERTHELLIRALHASGRQTDALTTYDALRTRLADEFGVDPSPRLRDLHVTVLRGDVLDPTPDPVRRSARRLPEAATHPGAHSARAGSGDHTPADRTDTLGAPLAYDGPARTDDGATRADGATRMDSGASPADAPGTSRAEGGASPADASGTSRADGGANLADASATSRAEGGANLADASGMSRTPEPQAVVPPGSADSSDGFRGRARDVADKVPPNNLRVRLTSFVGRDEDVAAIGRLLGGGTRLVTLVGPGGAGKTRLATEAALRFRAEARDGIWFVELAPLGDQADVAPAILATLGVGEIVGERRGTLTGLPTVRTAKDRLLEVLADRSVTLVLDNCEHLVAGLAELAEHLLGECPELRVIATSREPLGIGGEQLYPVGPLGLPPAGTADIAAGAGAAGSGDGARHGHDVHPDDERAGTSYAAVRLFVDRARAVAPGFTLTGDNEPAVAEICRRLDGMPLAIELAAARLRSLAPEQIVERLADRFRLLTTGSRTALPRHQTLRAVVEWSWDLLDDVERAVARRLSVFAGGATLDAAEHVCAGDFDVLGALASLVDKSLVEAVGDSGTVRYTMLETVKAYSAEQLAAAGETGATRQAHAEYFVSLAERAAPQLRRQDQLVWLTRLDADQDNLLGALRHAIDTADAGLAIRLGAVLGEYWNLRGRPAESRAWFESALALRGPTPHPQRVLMLFLYAASTIATLDPDPAELVIRRAVRAMAEIKLITRRHPDPETKLFGRIADGISAMIRQDRPAALRALDEALDEPDPWRRAMAQMMRAMLAENAGEVSQMRADLLEALDGFAALGDRWGMSLAQRGLASYALQAGEHETARDALTESLRLLGELGTRDGVSMLLIQLAQARAELGDTDGARAELARARGVAEADGSPEGDTLAKAYLGVLERRAGNLAEARRLTAEAVERMGTRFAQSAPQATAMLNAMLARVAVAEGNLTEAREASAKALLAAASAEDMPVLSAAVDARAELELRAGNPLGAARVLGIAAGLRGMRTVPDSDVRRTAAELRGLLGEASYEKAYDEGARLSRADAYAELDLPKDPRTAIATNHGDHSSHLVVAVDNAAT